MRRNNLLTQYSHVHVVSIIKRFVFYKNTLYKNIQDEIYQKVKNVLKKTFILHFC